MQYINFVVFLVSCLSPLNFILAVFMTVTNVVFLLFYSQHLYVNIKTMCYVVRQPPLPDNKLPIKKFNAHYKITMAEFSLAYAQTRECGIGIVSADGDSVQIQFF